ncbi:hypothetical protein JOC74_003167 [Bacillus capparidis]|uniref:Uncharacterized protein n=1 Tax=Bacillus capparidis TaxID=1840411 RepID=A0ABS4CZ94_9BACI|nr:hypothetical protein [Bacillus capparidis]
MFRNVEYLKSGNVKQRNAYQVIKNLGIMKTLSRINGQ